MLLRNTFIIAISNLVFFFSLPIIMALMLNEVRNVYFKRFVQTVILLLILRLGTFLDTGFEQIFNMQNAMNRSVSEVFDTYVYRMGITQSQFSYGTAVGLFKSIIGLVLVLGSDIVNITLHFLLEKF